MTPWQTRLAVRTLNCGGVIAYPTETVYGLGCSPLNIHAIDKLLALKGRPMAKGLILIGARLEHLAPYFIPPPAKRMAEIEASWPGPVTWLLPAQAWVPRWLTGNHDTIALRISSHPRAQALCNAFGGAIVSTSANPGGKPPARSSTKVRDYFGAGIDYIVPGQAGPHRKPSQIRDAVNGRQLR